MRTVGRIEELQTFQGGGRFGPRGDGWLVAAPEGAELLAMPLRALRWLERQGRRRSGPGASLLEEEATLLARAPLFSSCSGEMLRRALEEVLERREALWGEDPLASWTGLCIVRSGQLRLLPPSSEAGRPATAPAQAARPREPSAALCVLEAGDAIGEEALLGGPPALHFGASEVESVRLDAWVLPPERLHLAHDIGLVDCLVAAQEASQQQLRARAGATSAWARVRSQTLAEMRQSWRTADSAIITGDFPQLKPRGGVYPSWSRRELMGS